MTTFLDGIKQAYPAQYYAIYDVTAEGPTPATKIVDMWNAKGANGEAVPYTDLLSLPVAASMAALTGDQFALAAGAPFVWIEAGAILYPDRYYAKYDASASQPTTVMGWVDAWSMSKLSYPDIAGTVVTLPAAKDMIAVAAADWHDMAFRAPTGKGVQGGRVIDYTAPVPLVTQAQGVMGQVGQWASMATAMGETFGSQTKAYVAEIKAIIAGTSTATALPAAPITYTD